MATFSPVTLNKNSSDTGSMPAVSNGTITPARSIMLDPPKTSLRGMNKPKCIKCGNIARSRCDFQSCKGCCAKAQNPCLIHVLKQSVNTLPDKPPPSASPLPEQQPPVEAPSKGASTRLSSLRQLSSTYVNSLRAKRPLSRKDAIGINKWRFRKLREYIDGNAKAEDEAFDRYIQNVGLLEEAFFVDKSVDGSAPTQVENLHKSLVSAIKAKLQASTKSVERQKLQEIVDSGLSKLKKRTSIDDLVEDLCPDDPKSSMATARRRLMASRMERSTTSSDLLDKLARARTEDDLRPLLDLHQKLVNKGSDTTTQQADIGRQELLRTQDNSNPIEAVSTYSCPKLCTAVQIEQDEFSAIEERYSSLDQIIQL